MRQTTLPKGCFFFFFFFAKSRSREVKSNCFYSQRGKSMFVQQNDSQRVGEVNDVGERWKNFGRGKE